ncbi:unnamed protein product, partial [Chrysoparadoxa australica]
VELPATPYHGREDVSLSLPVSRPTLLLSESKMEMIFHIIGVLVFFTIHNYMQELIMSFESFNFGWSLGLLEVLGVVTCSFAEREVKGDRRRAAPMKSYVALSLILFTSSSMSNISLSFINYPTKVVFRSCKLIPTMLVAAVWNKRSIGKMEYLAALIICLGMVTFAMADAKGRRLCSSCFFFLLSSKRVRADAILPNFQERVYEAGSSRLEQTYYTNLCTAVILVCSMAASGNLSDVVRVAMADGQLALCMVVYGVVAYVAIYFHMTVVKKYGGVTAVLVSNLRKFFTICLSFLLFPKPFSALYLVSEQRFAA